MRNPLILSGHLSEIAGELQFNLGVPTGKDALSSEAIEPVFKGLADWDLGGGFSLGTNAGLDVQGWDNSGEDFARFLYAASVGYGVPYWEGRMRVFTEMAGVAALGKARPSEHTFDAGFTVLITPDIQADAFVQVGVTDASPDLQAGAGLSWRI
ncbi:MAG: transporter [Elusimicrobiota bacterium]